MLAGTINFIKSLLGPVSQKTRYLNGPKIRFWNQNFKKVGCVLNSNKVHFVSSANNFTVSIIFKAFETHICNGKQNSLTGPVITRSFEKRAPGHQFTHSLAFVYTHVSSFSQLHRIQEHTDPSKDRFESGPLNLKNNHTNHEAWCDSPKDCCWIIT